MRTLSYNKSYGLGTARLAITNIDGGSQPYYDEQEQIIILFNGEIYNFKDLILELELDGVLFEYRSEIELISNLYRKYNVDFAKLLNGMFSIAIYHKIDHKLVLIRDRFGIKPLYYYTDKNFILFGSEIKAILTSSLVELNLDCYSIQEFLLTGYVLDKYSIYDSVFEIEPGAIFIFEKNRVQKIRYSEFSFNNGGNSFNNTKNGLSSLLIEAVNKRVPEVDFICYLSGGLDSSSICSIIAEQNKNINTVSLRFEDKNHDEGKFSKLMSKKIKSNHTELCFNKQTGFGYWDKHYEGLIENPNLNKAFLQLSEFCNENGYKVALSGEGADECLIGYQYLQEFCIFNEIESKKEKTLLWNLYFNNQLDSDLYHNSYKKRIEEITSDYGYFIPCFSYDYIFIKNILKRVLKKSLKFRKHSFINFELLKTISVVDQAIYADIKTHLLKFILPHGDKLSMANSVELRTPFLDWDFFSEVLKTPLIDRFDLKYDKKNLREIMRFKLPKQIIDRKKKGITAPSYISEKNEYRRWVESIDYDTSSLINFIDLKVTIRLLNKYIDNSTNNHVLDAVFRFAERLQIVSNLPKK